MAFHAPRPVLLTGFWSALAIVLVGILYVVVLFAGGVTRGVPREPFFAWAEILTIVAAVLMVCLMAAIHLWTPSERRIFSMLALGWMLAAAAITTTVHGAELTVGRQMDAESRRAFALIFDFEWPSLLFAIEFVAWHIGIGLATFFAAFTFENSGPEKIIRQGLLASGLLCLAGWVGPATGNMTLRLIGVFGYAVVLPIICVPIALLFRRAEQRHKL